MRKLSPKKKKEIIIVASVGTAFLVGLIVWRAVQPKNALDFTAATSFWEREKVTDAAAASRVDLSASSATMVADPFDESSQVVQAMEATTTVYECNLPKAASYEIVFSLYNPTKGLTDTDFSLSLNGAEIAAKVPVRSLWQNAVADFEQDRNGNDVMPNQTLFQGFKELPVRDSLNRRSYPLVFAFPEGLNHLSLTMKEGTLLIKEAYLRAPTVRQSYSDYEKAHASAAAYEGKAITMEAEKPYYKNDNAIVYATSKDIDVTPYDNTKLRLNTVSLASTEYGQEVTYRLEAPETGYYMIGLSYLNEIANRADFLRLTIDGTVPFGEVASYPLYANSRYQTVSFNDLTSKEPYRFYLSQGVHEISLAVDGSLYSDITNQLKDIGDQISSLYLSLRTLSVQSGDTSREWNPDEDFPGVVDELASFSAQIKERYQEVRSLNGSSILNEGNVYLSNAYNSIDALLKEPQYLPNNNAELAEGSGSIQSALASAIIYLQTDTISLDKIFVSALNDKTVFATKSGWFRFWEGVKSFFTSFGSGAIYSDKAALEVWVNRPTMYIDLMQNMVDTTFTKETGIKVNFERLSDEGKLILSAAAGSSPDAVFGLSNWLPYELGIRGLTKNLRDFSDYNSVISRFAPGALLPLVSDDIGVGLPETQDFFVTYYRKDLFSASGLSIPNTWNEVIDLLPTLQRKGMNYYIPLSSSVASKSLATTAPFFQQMGANIWQTSASGAITTGIDSEAGLKAAKLMTNFYLLYGMQLQVNNFFDSFRNGSLPIGLAPMEIYQKLQYAAPELAGKWDIALAPGVKDDNGVIQRWQAGSATACLIMKNAKNVDNTWSLLKWWEDASTQATFANTLRNTVGSEYIYTPANLAAFDQLALPEAHKAVIRQQWDWMAEYPRVPGWYMLERELSNAWNNIVLNGANFRSAIDNTVTLTNKEIQRKMTQFGYLAKDGSLIKPFRYSTIEEIKQWQNA
jgi:ABC-type glycerol-3-phosphate transport system substrate-binding protein